MPTAHEHFSAQFETWEMRGRGWQIFDRPVYPEPPFVPFRFRPMVETPAIDDGRRETFLSSLARKLSSPKPPPPPAQPESEPEPEPTPLARDSLVELQASLPDKLDIAKDAFEQFLLNLSLCREPIAFELLGTQTQVTAQFVAGVEDASLLRRQLQAYFPEAAFVPREGALDEAWDASAGDDIFAVEFGLKREFMLPLACGRLDPFIGIVGALSELQQGELGLFQVLFQPVQEPWAESMMESVTHNDGRPFFVNSPELAGAAETKASRPLYAAVVRILVRTGSHDRTLQLARDLAGSLRVFAHPGGNELIPLANDDYPFEDHIEDVLRRQTRRTGMLLNSDELTGIVHIPSSAIRSPAFQRQSTKTKAAPSIVRQHGLLIGDNKHDGKAVPVYLTSDQRTRHTHIIGSSGTGKSSLLLNLIRQDIENGDGVAVLDPHGDLISQLLGVIPETRISDVVLVNPSDVDFPIGFNILQAHSDAEKNLLASDLIAVFRRLSSSWGDQMDTVLQNAILAFLESTEGGTLADLRRFLLEPPFRNQFLQRVSDPEVIYYWQKVFPQLSGGKSIGPILTRLQDFFARKPLRNMVSQRANKLDFQEIMDSGKIFLASLSEGLCGAENSYLLGTLLVSKFQQLAMARQSQDATARRHFWLYVDEFDHFISPSMAEILKGARKYRLGLTLAHQELHQLRADPAVESAVLTQPCTRIVFRVGDDDAKRLGGGFESFEERSIKNLEQFHAICRVERNNFDFNLALRKPVLPENPQSRAEAVIAAARKEYATPRAEVEAALLASVREDKPAAPARTTATEPRTPIAEHPADTAAATVSGKEEVPSSTDSAEEESRHQALKRMIGVEAEALDYTVNFEETVPPGKGRADMVLRRGDRVVACEISVKSPVEYEVGNIHKCLGGGFGHVAFISANSRRLEHVRELFRESATDEQFSRVAFYAPEAFIAQLHDWALDDPEGAKVEQKKPRKRKIPFGGALISDAERQEREKEMLRHIKEAMSRNPRPAD